MTAQVSSTRPCTVLVVRNQVRRQKRSVFWKNPYFHRLQKLEIRSFHGALLPLQVISFGWKLFCKDPLLDAAFMPKINRQALSELENEPRIVSEAQNSRFWGHFQTMSHKNGHNSRPGSPISKFRTVTCMRNQDGGTQPINSTFWNFAYPRPPMGRSGNIPDRVLGGGRMDQLNDVLSRLEDRLWLQRQR